MKVLIDNYTYDNFSLKVQCKQTHDEHGYTYGDESEYCGSTLEVDAFDIKSHKWSKGWPETQTGTSYVVICPLCGSWIEIPAEKIPKQVREKACEITKGAYNF